MLRFVKFLRSYLSQGMDVECKEGRKTVDQQKKGILLSVLTSATGISYFCNKNMLFFLNVETSALLWFSLGSVFYLLFLLPSSRRRDIETIWKNIRKILVVAFFTGIGAIFWFEGTRLAQPTNVAFIFQFSRVFIALAGVILLREKLSLREGTGVLLALIGGFFLTCSGGVLKIIGNLILFTSAFFYAIAHILVKIYIEDVGPIPMAAGRTMLVALILFIYSIMLGRLNLQVPIEAFSWALLGAFTAPFLAVISYYEALKRIEISKAAAILSTQPFFTTLYASLFFSTFPSPFELLGGTIVTLGVMILALSSRKKN
ncbi:TPA: DMT family transporter [Candidatus Bathyarchaeota archaeon]|nr:DMT family transporter [Candidatus Bathyarchaeota archaeon]